MFRVTSDALGAGIVTPKGPILLTSGLYSESLDWLSTSDPLLPNKPVQLAQQGYDVWIGESRGARYSNTHQTLNLELDADKSAYWDFSYPEIGREDFPAMIDTIIQTRSYDECGKVTLVAHSGAANSAMVMATELGIDDKVGRVVTLAPCLQINPTNWFFPNNDITSIELIYDFFEKANINSLFTPAHDLETAEFCEGQYAALCQAYLRNNDPNLRGGSRKFFEQIHQNTGFRRFQEPIGAPDIIDPITGSIVYERPEYDLEGITIPTFAVYADGELDQYCPPDYNVGFMDRVLGCESDWATGLTHTDMVMSNSSGLTDVITNCLPELLEPVVNVSLCPAAPPEKKKKSGSSSSSDSDSGSNKDNNNKQADGGSGSSSKDSSDSSDKEDKEDKGP